jgi:hypothetical protein
MPTLINQDIQTPLRAEDVVFWDSKNGLMSVLRPTVPGQTCMLRWNGDDKLLVEFLVDQPAAFQQFLRTVADCLGLCVEVTEAYGDRHEAYRLYR